MKTKLKPVSRKVSAKRAVVPLNDRRLTFGSKWDYAPAPEDSKNYVIAPRHELFINGKFVAPHSGSNVRWFQATHHWLADKAVRAPDRHFQSQPVNNPGLSRRVVSFMLRWK
jgi:hypothetical protein